MNWIDHLLNGKPPEPPSSSRTAREWDELVVQARSRDGRARQAAVRALASSSHAPALPVLLERLNDWVEAVRREARVAVQNFLRDEFIDAWLGALDGVATLTRGGRADHAEMLGHVIAWLLEPTRFARLRAGSVRVPREVERLVLRAQLRMPLESPQRLQAWRAAFGSPDIVLAIDATDALRSALSTISADDERNRAQLISLADSALESRFAGIRLAGLRVMLALGDANAQRAARKLCFDRSANTRALALAALRADDALISALQSQALAGLSPDRPARDRALSLEALCSLDSRAGLAQCHLLQDDPAASVRIVALRHVLAASGTDERDALVQATLDDPSSRVRRIAVAQVHRGANPPPARTLASLAQGRPESLGGVLGVASHLPPWERLALLLNLMLRFTSTPAASDLLRQGVSKWIEDMRHCFVDPTAGQKEAARQAWAASRDLLPRKLQDRAAFHLRTFGVLPPG